MAMPAHHQPGIVVVTITPGKADAYSRCPRQFADMFAGMNDRRQLNATTQAQQRGQYIHALIHRYNRALMRSQEPDVDSILASVPPPMSYLDAGSEEHGIVDLGRDSLIGYQTFLVTQNVERVLGAEQYVRTPDRIVATTSDCAVVFSGRIDCVARRIDGSLVCVDVKTGSLPSPIDLAEQPSTFIYRHLVHYAYGNERVEIVQVTPQQCHWVSTILTAEQEEESKQLCRDMAIAIKQQAFPQRTGPQCGHCAIITTCPAHQPHDAWDNVF